MTEQIGEKLTDLNRGDSVTVTIDGDHYKGEITDTKRWKCELNQGFMESGSIAIYLELDAESVERHDLSENHLLVTATENVPRDWDVPKVSVYNHTEDERIAVLGDVSEFQIY